jgi:hypothetical protein
VKVAEECTANEPRDRDMAYDAACVFALAGQQAKTDLAAQARHTDRAVALLNQSVALGWGDVDHLKADEDLISLRGRDDFKRLVGEPEAKYSPRPLEPATPPRPVK